MGTFPPMTMECQCFFEKLMPNINMSVCHNFFYAWSLIMGSSSSPDLDFWCLRPAVMPGAHCGMLGSMLWAPSLPPPLPGAADGHSGLQRPSTLPPPGMGWVGWSRKQEDGLGKDMGLG